ncbi:TetR/AcrR family transcriptional regulator [Sporolactobacillus sp. KGMB 08714]|uniref:TetR/AcrR family transcriptional regulator n=1 Tax=Sporolactobacillus sp. KGMB 08714 TaxID=3064704 RepID=UPI002FBD4B6D
MSRPKKGDRKEEIIEAGLEVFAQRGYYQTTTALIAEMAGISQPYVFKFFKTKEVLFETALNRAYERINRSFQNVEADPDHLIEAMIAAYESLSDSRPYEVALQVIGLSVPDAAIRAVTRQAC